MNAIEVEEFPVIADEVTDDLEFLAPNVGGAKRRRRVREADPSPKIIAAILGLAVISVLVVAASGYILAIGDVLYWVLWASVPIMLLAILIILLRRK